MPPMAPESTGGISAGFQSCLGRVCVPPYSQNACVAPRMELFGTARVPCQSTGIQSPKTDFHKTPSALT